MKYACFAAACLAAFAIGTNAVAQTNRPPAFTTPSAVSQPENSTARIYRPMAVDPDGDRVSIVIDGGRNGNRFTLDLGGYLRFKQAPDFENPLDGDGDNIYVVRLRASDGQTSVTQFVNVRVTDVFEGSLEFRVRRIASGLSQPLFALGRGDGTNRIFIVEKAGQVEVLDLGSRLLNPTPFLDVRSSIDPSGEQGLLGMALAPDFEESGVFYVHVNNLDGDTEIRRYRTHATNPDLADETSMDVVFFAEQTSEISHKGGWIGFGPDGLLYIALGDGGGADDPFANGQNRDALLGKILRLDVSRDEFPDDPRRDYAIPPGNPFAAGGGAPEILALGLRNPFRASFDRVTGNLYIGDVGQDQMEEVNLIRPGEAGLNFGWPLYEGTRINRDGASPAGLTPPITEYSHGTTSRQGRSVTGGYVYRGPVPALQGRYVFGDFVSNQIWSVSASAFRQGSTLASSSFRVRTREFSPDIGRVDLIASFGEDDRGDLYLIGVDGEVFQVGPP